MVVMILSALQPLVAQSWSMTGNNASSTSKLGTLNSQPLRIFTNNVLRMQISSTGNVGIGTAAPTYKLQVVGNGLFTSGLNVSGGGMTGNNSAGNGVYGNGVTGVFGNGSTNGVYGNGPNGVTGKGSNIGVVGSGGTYGIYGTGGTYGVVGNGSTFGVYGNGGPYGVYANGTTYGVVGNGKSYGLYGNGGPTGVFGNGTTYGVYGNGNSGSIDINSYGVYGTGGTYGVWGDNSSDIGVYGTGAYGLWGVGSLYGVTAQGSQNGVVADGKTNGVYATGGNWAGYFGGNVYSTGSYQTSDGKLKTNIADVSSAMDIINKLSPKTYQYRQDGNYKLMNLPVGNHYGLIAQDVEKVLPNLVKDAKFETRLAHHEVKGQPISQQPNGSGPQTSQAPSPSAASIPSETIDFKALNYVELIPILIKGIQEQQQQIDELKKLIEKIAPGGTKNLLIGSLGQNTPNPVSNSTRIQYNIPSNNTTAQLLLTDNAGRTVKTIQLTSSGFINLNTSRLSSGTYNYSLLIDGKIVETKNMIVIKN